MSGFECVGFTPKVVGAGVNCGNCKNYTGVTCLERKTLDELYDSTREIENLMRHDGYRREGGSVRQVRRGT